VDTPCYLRFEKKKGSTKVSVIRVKEEALCNYIA